MISGHCGGSHCGWDNSRATAMIRLARHSWLRRDQPYVRLQALRSLPADPLADAALLHRAGAARIRPTPRRRGCFATARPGWIRDRPDRRFGPFGGFLTTMTRARVLLS